MSTPAPRPRRLRHRLQSLWQHAARSDDTPSDTGGSFARPEAVVAWATRDLLRAQSSEEVAGTVAQVIDLLGGMVVPAAEAPAHALPMDVSFGVSEPMLPVAEPGSQALRDLTAHLPALVADARLANDGIIRTAHLSADVATDAATGLDTRATFVRALGRLTDHDAAVVVRLTVPETGTDDDLADAVRAFAGHVRSQLTPGDLAARIEEDEFGVLLKQAGTAGTAVAVSRLQGDWQQSHPDVTLHIGVAPFRDSGTMTLRDAYEALDRELDAADAAAQDDTGAAPDVATNGTAAGPSSP